MPASIVIFGMFIATIIVDRDDEDKGFSLLSPIITTLFFFAYGTFTALYVFIKADDAILFYDTDVRLEYNEYIAE